MANPGKRMDLVVGQPSFNWRRNQVADMSSAMFQRTIAIKAKLPERVKQKFTF